MLPLHGFRQMVEGKPDIMMVNLGEASREYHGWYS